MRTKLSKKRRRARRHVKTQRAKGDRGGLTLSEYYHEIAIANHKAAQGLLNGVGLAIDCSDPANDDS